MTPEEQKRLKRRIVDFLFKYSTLAQLLEIARILGVKHD